MPTCPITTFACSQATGSSSITSTRISCGCRCSVSFSSALRLESASVTVTVNVVPLPFSLSTSILPFISFTRLLVIDMPNPVLPYLFVDEESSWLNASKIFGRYSLLMPMPVSLMIKRNVEFPSNRATFCTMKRTFPPAGVNFTALPRILISTCRNFISSPM